MIFKNNLPNLGFFHFYNLLILKNSWTNQEEARIYTYMQKRYRKDNTHGENINRVLENRGTRTSLKNYE